MYDSCNEPEAATLGYAIPRRWFVDAIKGGILGVYCFSA
jgi:hypothetical protein